MKTNWRKTLTATVAAILIAVGSLAAQGGVPYITKNAFDKKVVNTSNLKKWVYLGDKPAIIDFTASWCPPCKQLAPILDSLYAKYGDRIYIYKVDVDDQKELAKAFGIRSIPTMLFIPMKGEPEKTTGLLPKDQIEKKITDFLLKK